MECCGNTIKDLYGFSCPLKCSTYILQSVEIKENNNLENDKIKEDKQISVNTCMINKVKITLLGSEKDHFFEELILEEIRYASDGKNKVYRISSSNQKLPPEFKENAYIQIKNDDHIVLKKAFIDKRNDQFSMIVQKLS